ncbi:MAG: cobalamin-binding protein [Chlorobiales bacterium]|nr:cobalamin-binding protein [Chlorobiales bacterium]
MPKRSPLKFQFSLSLLLTLVTLSISACSPQGQEPARSSATAPKRIISLAPSLTEMLYAIGAGDQLVGRTSACDWPQEAEKVPVVGAFGRPSLELLAAARPDLVVDVDLADEETGRKISAMNIRNEHIHCQSPDDIPQALRKLGSLTGHERQADSLAGVIERGLDRFRKESAEMKNKPGVYLEIWDDPLWTGGKNSFVSSLISYAGGRNIGDAVNKEYFEISPEWVITQNPDVIACMYMSKEIPAVDNVTKRPGWSAIDAVKNRRIDDRFDNRLYLRPGPRILEGIEGMKAFLHKQ